MIGLSVAMPRLGSYIEACVRVCGHGRRSAILLLFPRLCRVSPGD